MKFSRRELTVTAAVAVLARGASGQTPPVAGDTTDQALAAREANQRASEALAKFEIPMAMEPAFQFKP